MAKKSVYFCKECGYESLGWLGKCPACSTWNTFTESTSVTGKTKNGKNRSSTSQGESWLSGLDQRNINETEIVNLDNIDANLKNRFNSNIKELDHVLGGGFVEASLVLLGGPGMGKSTLLLQVCKNLGPNKSLLYICGEESPSQIKLRAERIGAIGCGIKLMTETRFEYISEKIINLKPDFIIVDSIQTLYLESLSSCPGSISQVRDVAFGFLRLAKALNITVCLVGHVTKDGQIAGPRVLEHMVDTVLYFDGEDNNNLRIVRAVKNRFGPSDEVGLFTMTEKGLEAIENPSETLLRARPHSCPGTVITCGLEGSRTYLMEIQALLSESSFVSPQRMTQGVDKSRLSMLLAIIEKILKVRLAEKDAYVNVVGGIKLNDTACDLAIAAAIISSFKNKAFIDDIVVLGELGLTGELRPVRGIEKRLNEANQMGMKKIFLPACLEKTLKRQNKWPNIDIIYVDNLREFVDITLM